MRKTNTSMKLLLTFLLVVTSSFFVNADFLVLEKDSYSVNDVVNIKIEGINHGDAYLVISSQTEYYKFLGDYSSGVFFIPKNNDEYSIILKNISDDSLIEDKSFVVGTTNKNHDIVRLDKNRYLVNENVDITINNPNDISSLVIQTNNQNYKFLGDIRSLTRFVPSKEGIYEVLVYDYNNLLLGNLSFTVGRTSVTPKNFGISNYYFSQSLNNDFSNIEKTYLSAKIKNSKGYFLDSDIIIDEFDKFNSFLSGARSVNSFAKKLDLIPKKKFVEKIRFNNVNLSNGFDLGIEELPVEKADVPGVRIKSAFAIDPERISFVNGSIEFVAVGYELYKCAEWNFSTQTCHGTWDKILDMVPGEKYNITITPNDPAYAQSSYNADGCFNEDAGATCTAGELSSIQTDDTNYLPFDKGNGNSPLRVSFPDETDLIDEIVECVIHVKAWDSEGNTWNLQLGNYSSDTWGTASGQTMSTSELDHTWDCISYFNTVSDDESRYDTFGIRLATTDAQKSATGNIDHVWVYINYSIRDTIAPYWSSPTTNPSSPATYSPSASYQFNTTWLDNEQVDTVLIEHNFTGTYQQYPITGNSGSAYYYNYGALGVGSYVWRTIANDTSNNWNYSMPNQTYIVSKASSVINLYLNSSQDNITINETQSVNITAVLAAGQGNILLYVNGTLVQSGPSPLINISSYNNHGDLNVTAVYLGNQNYTATSKTLWIYVKDVTPPNNITNLNETLTGEAWILWNWTNPTFYGDLDHVEVWVSGLFKTNLSAGIEYYNATSLSSNTTYEIQLRPVDVFGNKGFWANDTATTNESGDVTPPIITNVANVSITDSSVNITWTTDEPATSLVKYGLITGVYTLNKSDLTLVTSHNVLVTSLLPSTTYYYVVNSSDSAGNTNQSIEYFFTTQTDQTPPNWSNPVAYPSSPINYSPIQNYQFNVSWTDNGIIDVVWVEHNFNGSTHNYSIIGKTDDIYYYNYGPIAAGTYSWKMYANDSESNLNWTNSFTYTVNKASSSVNLLINGTDSDYSINESSYANLTGYLVSGESYLLLYIDDLLINNGTSPLNNNSFFGTPGQYVINLSSPATQNYTSSYESHVLIVNDTYAPTINLTSPPPESTDIDGDVTLYFNVTDTGVVSNCSLYLNGTLNNSKDILTEGENFFNVYSLDNGFYLWNVSCTDTANHVGWSQTWNFTVFINEFYPQIYPVSCSQETGTCNTSLINVSDSLYQEHSWVDKQDTEDYAYFNFSNPSITAGSTIHWMNLTHQKYQEYSLGFYEMYWYNTSSSSWEQICQQSTLTDTTPPSYDTFSCEFNETSGGFPTVNQINNGIELRARWYYSGGDAANKYYGTNFIQIYLKYTEDLTPPTVVLVNPEDEDYRNKGDVSFQYIPDDANLNNCTIWGDFNGSWASNKTNTSPISDVLNNFTVYLDEGYYNWNVQCFDVAGNSGWASNNYSVNITNPDLQILSNDIFFSNSSPREAQNITINATIRNVGNVNATIPFKVQFFDGDPDLGGVQIGVNKTINYLGYGFNATVNTSFIISRPGPIDIYVVVDPPLSTNGSVVETDETNNKAYNTVNVPAWSLTFGNVSGTITLAKASNETVSGWDYSNPTGNVFVVETGSYIDFSSLQSLGRRIDNSSSLNNDFEELDSELNMTNFVDGVNTTYTLGGLPKQTSNFNIYYKNLSNVAIVNSTINDNFVTGILWDYSDGGLEYDGSQDVLFITKINQDLVGEYGVYDYEVYFPALLRDYHEGVYSTVDFYTELT
ncbi:hypothetical protein GOV05_01110 [Candidatus Woesearchaeota archaeon]|nr:hypothetical protein [Candidatus Woesearchaeota archaeon]